MNAVLLQAASGEHAQLLQIAERWHRDYCCRHSIGCHLHYGRVQYTRPPVWDKILWLLYTLALVPRGTLIIYLDADTLIVQPSFDLRLALPPGADVAMMRSKSGELNAGAFLLVASDRSIAWLRRVWMLGPVRGSRTREQSRMNLELPASGLTVAPLDSRFNACEWAVQPVVEPAVIRAWHAQPLYLRKKSMLRTLELLGAAA